MFNKLSLIPLLLIIMFATGCSSIKQQPYNHGMNKHIKSIGIVKPIEPAEKRIFYYNHPGNQFGLIGALAAEAEFSSKTSDYEEAVQNHNFKAGDAFINTLKTELESNGYEIQFIERPKGDDEFLDNYSNSNENIDAYLDFYYTSFGYIAGGPASDYKATARMVVQLVDKNTSAILYSDILSIGESFGTSNEYSYLGFKEDYSFPDFDLLLSASDQSIQGLRKSNEDIAKFVAQQFIPKAKKEANAALKMAAEQ